MKNSLGSLQDNLLEMSQVRGDKKTDIGIVGLTSSGIISSCAVQVVVEH